MFGCYKTSSSKKTLKRSLVAPLHASLYRAPFFCCASQVCEKVLNLPKQQFILFFKDRLIWGVLPSFCSLHQAFFFTLALWNGLSSCQSRADPPSISGSKSAAGSPATHVSAMTLLGSCCTGSVKSKEERLPVQHFLNPREVMSYLSKVVISDIHTSIHCWAMPTLFFSLPWSLICLRSVQLNYFLNLFVDQFSWLM